MILGQTFLGWERFSMTYAFLDVWFFIFYFFYFMNRWLYVWFSCSIYLWLLETIYFPCCELWFG
jgi:hypothetical protein